MSEDQANAETDEAREGQPARRASDCYRVSAIDHQGVFGEVVKEIDGHYVTTKHGIDATTCGRCGAVITRGRLATANEVSSHRRRCHADAVLYLSRDSFGFYVVARRDGIVITSARNKRAAVERALAQAAKDRVAVQIVDSVSRDS